eukprot:687270-Hanusia_phi.AAC.1
MGWGGVDRTGSHALKEVGVDVGTARFRLSIPAGQNPEVTWARPSDPAAPEPLSRTSDQPPGRGPRAGRAR